MRMGTGLFGQPCCAHSSEIVERPTRKSFAAVAFDDARIESALARIPVRKPTFAIACREYQFPLALTCGQDRNHLVGKRDDAILGVLHAHCWDLDGPRVEVDLGPTQIGDLASP